VLAGDRAPPVPTLKYHYFHRFVTYSVGRKACARVSVKGPESARFFRAKRVRGGPLGRRLSASFAGRGACSRTRPSRGRRGRPAASGRAYPA
jgi:hypothetical protein